MKSFLEESILDIKSQVEKEKSFWHCPAAWIRRRSRDHLPPSAIN